MEVLVYRAIMTVSQLAGTPTMGISKQQQDPLWPIKQIAWF